MHDRVDFEALHCPAVTWEKKGSQGQGLSEIQSFYPLRKLKSPSRELHREGEGKNTDMRSVRPTASIDHKLAVDVVELQAGKAKRSECDECKR